MCSVKGDKAAGVMNLCCVFVPFYRVASFGACFDIEIWWFREAVSFASRHCGFVEAPGTWSS